MAEAGPDQRVDANSIVTLSGDASDEGGAITRYAWTQIAGTRVTLENADTPTATFISPALSADETLVFELRVTDDEGAETVDRVEISVAAAMEALLITAVAPQFGLPGDSVSVFVEGADESFVVLLNGEEILPESVSEDFGVVTLRLPDSVSSGPLQVRQGNVSSNNVWFSVSENGVVSPDEDEIATDELGNRTAIGYIVVLLDKANDTLEEAERLAALVAGDVVGRIDLINAWQIGVNADSLAVLEAIAANLEAESSVRYTLLDIEVAADEIDWSGDPDRTDQRSRNAVEEAVALYESQVHPTEEGKVRPFFMALGVSEQGIDFTHPDFSGYAADGAGSSGNVAIYASQSSDGHGSNVTGVIAAELGDLGNAGPIRALSDVHGGANINVGIGGGQWAIGRLASANQQLEAGARVINWSWGLHRAGAENCAGNALITDIVPEKTFAGYASAFDTFFTNLEQHYPNAVIVASAGNGATDAGNATNRMPTAIDSHQLIVVGAHTSGGSVNDSLNEDDEAGSGSATACFDTSVIADVKRAAYSNYGERVDITASGSIMGLTNDSHVVGNRGSSYAAPLVSATVALMQSVNPNLTPAGIKDMLRRSAFPVENKVKLAGTSGKTVFTRALTLAESAANAGNGARLNMEGAIRAALDSLSEDTLTITDPVTVVLEPGTEEITRAVSFTIPADGPVFDKVDIMFLVDVSGSYTDDLATFRERADELINAFDEAGANVQIGLASFSDFPEGGFGDSIDYPFRLDQPLTSDFERVKSALEVLTILSGSDVEESQLEALFQTAQNESGWRTGGLPLIFLATDAAFHNSDDEPGYPGTGYAATLAALNARGIRVFGLQSGGGIFDVLEIVDATGGDAFDLSRDSSEIVEAVQNALSGTNERVNITLEPFGDFAGLVKSVTPKVEGASAGDPITDVGPGDTVAFDVVFARGSFTAGNTRTFSFRLSVIADDVATIQEVPVTVILN